MPTLQAIRRQLYDELDGYSFGFNYTASSISTTAVTTADPRMRDSRLGTNTYQGAYHFRPALSGADRIKPAGDLTGSTGTLDNVGSVWVDVADTDFELVALHPSVLTNLINDALELEYTEWEGPLVAGPNDNDMESTDEWDGTVTGTSAVNMTSQAKQTTAAEVFSGLRSTRGITSAAGGYIQSSLTRVRSGAGVLYWAILKADIGEVTLQLVDQSGNVIDSVATSEEQWTYVQNTVTVGTSVEGVRLRVVGTDTSDEFDVDIVGIQPFSERRVYLPSWADEAYKIKTIDYLSFTDGLIGADQWNAFSQRTNRIGTGWRFVKQQNSANPNYIEFDDPVVSTYPLWVTGQRPWSDFITLSAEADETDCPLHVIVRRVKYLLGARYQERFPGLAPLALSEIRAAAEPRRTDDPTIAPWRLPRVS